MTYISAETFSIPLTFIKSTSIKNAWICYCFEGKARCQNTDNNSLLSLESWEFRKCLEHFDYLDPSELRLCIP